MSLNSTLLLIIALAPLAGAIVAGIFRNQVGRVGAHTVTIAGVALSCALSFYVLYQLVWGGAETYNQNVYTWFQVGGIDAHVGFLIDRLTALMMCVVTFVSLMVHIYTIGYMADDPGYQRFFSYISLFTFSMLMLVMSNNFLQLFFGWEAVGLVSYLLIGFWYERPTAIYASLKAFIANRVGDFGFVLGLGLVLAYFGTLDYAPVFAKASSMARVTLPWPGAHWNLMTAICICLFVGAMGKSAQVPLHVWLPDSMEGPTPISALIHAATMVTAGIFMVARMSPLFEWSAPALSVVTIIGAITALFMAFLGIVQNDIKRVIAYSTLSQLCYMTVALGVSAYSAAIFHLMTHAFFKALLFLAAGSVIVALHHEQDLRRMGGLRRYMPITYVTAVVGSLALAGVPLFAGFFSKDSIIEAVALSHVGGHTFAYVAVLGGVFVTAFYSFRLLFLAFHGDERFHHHAAAGQALHDEHATRAHEPSSQSGEEPDPQAHEGGPPRESPWVITLPLILLAIPSIYAGWAYIEPMLFGNWFGNSIVVHEPHAVLSELSHEWHGAVPFVLHGLVSPAFWLAIAGIAAAVYLYLINPAMPGVIVARFRPIYTLLDNKYYFDRFNDWFFAGGARAVGRFASSVGDRTIIDGIVVNGTARLIGFFSHEVRRIQSGYVYHYAFVMIVGVFVLLYWWGVR